MDYSDSSGNFKLAHASELGGISKRNIGILAMWLTGLGIPEAFHEFVIAIFVTGNWDEVQEDEITLKRLARSISPGTDTGKSILRTYERLRKSSREFYEWQEQQQFQVIPREIAGINKTTRIKYKFPHYQLLIDLFHLPQKMSQKQVRAEVAKALDDLMLPPSEPRKKREKTPKSLAAENARTIEQLLNITGSTEEAASYLIAAWRSSFDDRTIKEILKSFDLD